MKDRKQYMKEWREKNKESLKEHQREYRNRDKEKWVEYNKEYNKVYREENRESINENRRKYQSNRRKTDPWFRLRGGLSSRLNQAIKKQGATKDSTTMDLTGCNKDVLISHLESQFTDGMTWDNYGKWHVDHIKPCILFDLLLDTEQKACFHYSNLQPLWAADNLSKSDKYD